MFDYENRMLRNEYESTGISINYDKTLGAKRDDLLQKNSTLFIFGCEESYGCLSGNNVRDKDANSACLMACELVAYAKSFGKTLIDLRDDMYMKYGYFGESVLNIYYEGADGAQKIKNILASYQKNPPKQIDSSKVTEIVDFAKQTIQDADGKLIPPQQFFFITLDNGAKFALRASGTEPKIKFYLFAEAKVDDGFQLEETKKTTSSLLEEIKRFLKTDVDERANFVT
jgi:phosphoglucomutase